MNPVIDSDLWASPAFRRDSKTLFDLNEKALENLDAVTRGPKGFGDSESNIAAFSEAVGLSRGDAASVFRICEFLYTHSRHEKATVEDLVSELSALARDLGIDLEPKRTGYQKLFADRSSYDQARQRTLYTRAGPVQLVRSTLVCDVRAVLDEDGKTVLGFVPIVVGDFLSGDGETFAYQLSEKRLADLKQEVEAALSTLAKLKEKFADDLLLEDE